MPDLLCSFDYTWPFYAGALAGYLLGSIPFGLVLTRLAGLGDIRKIGSGNIGATNVLRTGNKALAAATLLLDGGKGAVAVLVANAMFGPDMARSEEHTSDLQSLMRTSYAALCLKTKKNNTSNIL